MSLGMKYFILCFYNEEVLKTVAERAGEPIQTCMVNRKIIKGVGIQQETLERTKNFRQHNEHGFAVIDKGICRFATFEEIFNEIVL